MSFYLKKIVVLKKNVIPLFLFSDIFHPYFHPYLSISDYETMRLVLALVCVDKERAVGQHASWTEQSGKKI